MTEVDKEDELDELRDEIRKLKSQIIKQTGIMVKQNFAKSENAKEVEFKLEAIPL